VLIIICLTKQTRHVNRSIWVWWRTWVLCRTCMWVPDIVITFLCVTSITSKQCNLDRSLVSLSDILFKGVPVQLSRPSVGQYVLGPLLIQDARCRWHTASIGLAVTAPSQALRARSRVRSFVLTHGSKRLHLKMCEIDNGNFID